MATNRIARTLCSVTTAAVILLSAGVAVGATAEPTGLDPDVAAKVAREKIKQTQRAARHGGRDGGGKGGGGQCGQVDIGNDDSGDKRASKKLNERSRTVIVTGDVINAARCR
jgi:hypothetical protein